MPGKQADSYWHILRVSLILCLVCSALVSGFAVGLRDWHEENKQLDKKRNILSVAGLIQPQQSLSSQAINRFFEASDEIWVEEKAVDLRSGAEVDAIDGFSTLAEYDALIAAKDLSLSEPVAPEHDSARIRRREHFAFVYLVHKQGQLDQVLLPIRGMGLWSILYGFISLDSDIKTIRGIGFYQHGETPGLGGEVDNQGWKDKWAKGKLAFDEKGDVRIEVIKGAVGPNAVEPQFKVDGLSGATFTSKGVTEMLRYWLSDQGFGPYLDRLRKGVASDG